MTMDQKLVCGKDACTGCMACVAVCPKNAITVKDTLSAYNAVIDEGLCINCKRCEKVCQNLHPTVKHVPIAWYEGWAKEQVIRSHASSGGIATALATGFIQNGGYVCSCVFEQGKFTFQLTNREEDIWRSMGSKYVKSNPESAYVLVREALRSGKRVLFIGLPCQVAGMKRFVGETLQEQLYTVDLICHGTPSPKVLEIFLHQYQKTLANINMIQFRIKAKMQLVVDDEGIVKKGVSDCYTISFLNGINYTENCYHCNYASSDRVSDLTLGDSWGSENTQAHKKGISLVLCQTEKGQDLLDKCNVQLSFADIDRAIGNNHQLVHPSHCPDKRTWFFDGIGNGKKYNRMVWRLYFKQCFKQFVKKCLMEMRLIS